MEHFGDIRNDPYHWLRDRRNPGVRRLLERENAHTASVYDAYGGTQLSRTLFNEMRARWKEDDASLPYRDRSYWYYTRTVPNADYPVYCRRPVNDRTAAFVQEVAQLWAHDASAPLPPYDDEVVYLDVNLLVKELRLGYVELGEMEVSPDETQLAVALDCSNGKEIYTIFVLDIIDVNYGRWLEEQSELHRSWAAAMLRSKQSIYASPTSALPPQRSPTTPSGARWKGGGTANNNNNNNGSSSSSGRRRGNDNSGSVTSAFQAAAASPTTRTQTQQVAPKHKITRRIDVFDAGGEVLWLNPTALLYVGLDGKMRSCRIIYHDLTALVQAEEADIICYEERDEAFWVGSLCFSADERFAMFSVASGSCAEAYVIPCDARSRRRVSGVPVVRVAVDDDDSKGDESDHKNHGSNGAEKKNSDHCAVYCFAERTSHVDHDIDHHESLFGDGVGAWVVVTTNAPPGPENFRVAYVLDDDVALRGDGGQTLSTVLQWRALFAYDPDISVEGVDFLRDYLLINVRRAAFATELLLPVRTLWKRWRDGSGGRMQPLSRDGAAASCADAVEALARRQWGPYAAVVAA
ncbi:putative oligopeptidase B, putative,serine peptidase, clan SC, family S9A-like protein [Trypanosoma grayi]|uniref:putative oligopeptidase B, putative,serine peptidase, clan SC, family S9A-like protein n=1 Tax=Trypanosoma grayi TaxID=71804 RepID=UPI0004F4429B|nr:putative oligopeptidase B, putative,serine peptidase, clan SC, family S9A-like protein [Trypanosoma grayi]KEG07945.1 putative oligopeptidase B, putative,serine peptidase, clan SC, family S9A-like protein [Trypanosoma grayi]